MGVCNCSMFCCTLLYVHFSIAIILMGKRELIALLNLSSWCLVMVERLFLTVPRGCLQFVIVVFPDHTHLLFLILDLSGILCKFCDKGIFGLRKDSSFSTDQCCWCCSHKKVSIRQGSWFSNSNLTLETIVLLTYFWVYRTEQEFVKHELGISHTTIVDWYNFSREVCISILENFSQKIGGPGKIIEIDESKFGKRQFHKGRREDGVWVF